MSSIHNKNVNIDTQINNPLFFGSVFYAKDPNRKFLSIREPQMLNVFLDRQDSLRKIQEQFINGKNIVVIFGESGLGKNALANIYYHHFRNEYEQKGWVNYNLNICKSIVQSFDSHNTEINGRKNDNLYSQLAASEIIYLKNNPKKRLIVVNGISDWEDILNHIDFFQINHTHFLFTALSLFKEDYWNNFALEVENLPVPRISNSEVKSIFEKYCTTSIPPHFVQKLNSNLFLINLLTRQAPKDNPKAVHTYFGSIFKDSIDEKAILVNAFKISNLSDAEVWTLLQIATLPEDNYDAEDLTDFLLSDSVNDILDISDLRGFKSFKSEYPDFQSSIILKIEEIVPKLRDNGWLTETEDEQFRMHKLLRMHLKSRINLDVDFFYEISNSLSIAFYKEYSGLIVDDLKYEIHLQSFLSFLPEQPKELYIQNLWKLIALVERNGHYYYELELREKHLLLLRKSSDSENSRLVQTLVDISSCQRRCGDLLYAKNSAIEALRIAEVIPGLSLSSSQTALGLVLKDLGDYSGAKELLEKAMQSAEKNFGSDHPTTAVSSSNLATVLQALGDYSGAKELLEKAMQSAEKNFGPDHPTTARSSSNLALVLQALGDYSGAKELLEKAMQSDEKNFGPDHPTTAVSSSNLALVLNDLGDYEAALTYSSKSVRIFDAILPEGHPHIKTTRAILESIKSNMKKK